MTSKVNILQFIKLGDKYGGVGCRSYSLSHCTRACFFLLLGPARHKPCSC